jgi:hypothetical protein
MLLPEPRHMPCPECGASVDRPARAAHTCDREHLGRFRFFQLRDEVAAFEDELAAYLDSAHGRFAVWDAQRARP